MKIFDEMVEPILLYSCEVSMANIPENTDIEKFKKDMWSHKNNIKIAHVSTPVEPLTSAK